MKRRIGSLLLTLLITALLPLSASAQTFQPHQESNQHFTVEIPDDMYIFTEETPITDGTWAAAGITDPSETLELFGTDQSKGGMNALAVLKSQDGETTILIKRKSSDESAELYSFLEASDADRTAFIQALAPIDVETLSKTVSEYDHPEILFFRIQIDGTMETTANTIAEATQTETVTVHERIYGTVLNGYLLDFDLYTDGRDITHAEEQLLEEIVDSVKITHIITKEEATAIDYSALTVLLVGVLIIAAFIIGMVLYFSWRKRRDKRQKKEMAERLSVFHQAQRNGTLPQEQMQFANITECSNEAIRAFSIFHAYIKNIWPLAIGIAVSLLLLIFSIVSQTEWYMILICAALLVYYAYKIITASSEVEKVQRKIYAAGNSETAKYVFYESSFKVSGIQAVSTYPYFQITSFSVSKDYIYLYYGPDNAYIVARSGFTTGSDTDFITFIKKKVETNGSK